MGETVYGIKFIKNQLDIDFEIYPIDIDATVNNLNVFYTTEKKALFFAEQDTLLLIQNYEIQRDQIIREIKKLESVLEKIREKL